MDSFGVECRTGREPGALISLTVGDQTYNVDTYYPNQTNWTLEEIDVAFQLDGNYRQEPYNVWLDKVQLTAN